MKKTTRKIQLRNTNVSVNDDEIYFLTYPMGLCLTNYVAYFSVTTDSTPAPPTPETPTPETPIREQSLLFVIISNDSYTGERSVFPEHLTHGQKPKIYFLAKVKPNIFLTDIGILLEGGNIKTLVICGLSDIAFNNTSPEKFTKGVQRFIRRLRRFQRKYQIPILLTSRSHPDDSGLDVCVPTIPGHIDCTMQTTTDHVSDAIMPIFLNPPVKCFKLSTKDTWNVRYRGVEKDDENISNNNFEIPGA